MYKGTWLAQSEKDVALDLGSHEFKAHTEHKAYIKKKKKNCPQYHKRGPSYDSCVLNRQLFGLRRKAAREQHLQCVYYVPGTEMGP